VFDPIPPRFSRVSRQVSKCAEQVYDRLGPGLLPAAYKGSLAIELQLAGLTFECNVELPLVYEGVRIESAMQLDFVVEEAVLVSVIAAPRFEPIDEMQLRTLLKFSELRVGLLLNFHGVNFKQAVKKITA
jgi:GxxExxY protein